jgi:L-alanine-DL-glutamate epimerase-like enolase superfamily enzyme
VTAFTLSVASPQDVAARAHTERERPVLKLKLDGGAKDAARVEAARNGAPGATLLVDANEAWTAAHYERMAPVLAACSVALLEQPFPAGRDAILEQLPHSVPVGADESFWGDVDLAALARRYEAINLKLDKTGGLTHAIDVLAAAKAAGLDIMIGCMVSTSLAVAPALLLAHGARYIDLDGPLLLARDRTPGLRYEGSIVHPSEPSIWG